MKDRQETLVKRKRTKDQTTIYKTLLKTNDGATSTPRKKLGVHRNGKQLRSTSGTPQKPSNNKVKNKTNKKKKKRENKQKIKQNKTKQKNTQKPKPQKRQIFSTQIEKDDP